MALSREEKAEVEEFVKSFAEQWKDYNNRPIEIQAPACMHKTCPGCASGRCNGIHMISCPCPSCSPSFSLTTS